MRVPVAGVCMIRRGETNSIKPFGGAAAIHALLEQTARPKDPMLAGNMLDLLDKLLKTVSVWELHCNMEPEAALLSYQTMFSGRKDV